MDTADELEAIVGQISPEPVSPSTPRALSPIPQEPSSLAPRASAQRAARPVTDVAPTRTSAPHHKQGKLPEYLKSLTAWWGCLSPKMRESVELRAAGDDNDAIARKMGKTAKSVSVMINVARRRLEARRDASVEQPPGDQEEKPEEGGEGEGDDDEPEPDGGPGEGVDVDVDVGPEPARDFNLQGTPNEKGSFVEEAGGSNLVAYLRSIRTYRVLTREEELELTTRFEQTRDPRLARRLVQANLRFVVRAALSYSRERGKLIDLIQEGNLGLMRGVEKFDPSKGMRLLTYAQHWIHAYIKIFIIKDKRLIRMGKTQGERFLFWSLNKTRNRLKEENGGVEPTNEEIALVMKVKPSAVEMMSTRLAPEIGLQRPAGDRGDGDDDVQEWLPDDKARPDEVVEKSEGLQKIHQLLSDIRLTLNPRMQHILDVRILAEEPLTLEELAQSYGVSRERIRQLEERLKDKIRKRYNSTLRSVA